MSGGRMSCDMENQSLKEHSQAPLFILLILILCALLRCYIIGLFELIVNYFQRRSLRRQYHEVLELHPFGSLHVNDDGTPHQNI